MSFLDDRAKKLILDLLLGRISEEAFCRGLSVDADKVVALGLTTLQHAVRERDPVGVEYGLYLGLRWGVSADYLQVLPSLASADWHQRHADAVDALAKLKAPESVDTLYHAALSKHDYLEYDEAYVLGVKCIWALGSIHSRESVDRLGDLLRCGNSVLETNAEAQLRRVAASTAPASVREAASSILKSRVNERS